MVPPGTYKIKIHSEGYYEALFENIGIKQEEKLQKNFELMPIKSNQQPISNAGPDQEVEKNTLVNLDGSQSYDSDGDTLSYQWIQQSGPNVTLINNHSNSASFMSPQTCPKNTTMVFELTVTDSYGLSNSDTCSIHIMCNQVPILISPVNGSINEQYPISLKISNDTDSPMCTHWQISDSNDFNRLIVDSIDHTNQTTLEIQDTILDEGFTYFWRVKFCKNVDSEWSDTFSFKTQENTTDTYPKNGIPDEFEIMDKSIDMDDNNMPDMDQIDSQFKCIKTFDKTSQVSIKALENVINILTIKTMDKNVIDDETNRPEQMPYGLIFFKLYVDTPGCTATVQVYFETTIPDNSQWYKYDTVLGWYDYSQHMRIDSNKRSVLIEYADGGYGDADGIANGIIVDPSGLVIHASSQNEPIRGNGDDGGGGCFMSILSTHILYSLIWGIILFLVVTMPYRVILKTKRMMEYKNSVT